MKNFRWDQIWLNEGFATLFERLLVDNIDPTFRAHHFMNAFSIHNRAFINDARDTTRPMTWDVNTLTEIDNSFDRIAYEKCENLQKINTIKNLIKISFINSWCCLENVLVHSWRKQFQEISSKIPKNLVSTR